MPRCLLSCLGRFPGHVSAPTYAALKMAGSSGLNARTWSKRSVRTVFRKASQAVRSLVAARGASENARHSGQLVRPRAVSKAQIFALSASSREFAVRISTPQFPISVRANRRRSSNRAETGSTTTLSALFSPSAACPACCSSRGIARIARDPSERRTDRPGTCRLLIGEVATKRFGCG